MSLASLAKNGAYMVPASLDGEDRYLNLVVTGNDAQLAGANTLGFTRRVGEASR